MAQSGKMDALKSATKSLLDQLNSAVTVNGDVYVSIVPFVKDVNLSAGNYNSNWIDWTDWNAVNDETKPNTANYDTNVVAPDQAARCQLMAKATPDAAVSFTGKCVPSICADCAERMLDPFASLAHFI
jgi:hypothetical protein